MRYRGSSRTGCGRHETLLMITSMKKEPFIMLLRRKRSQGRLLGSVSKFIDHEGHEVTQRHESPEDFLCAPFCPSWLIKTEKTLSMAGPPSCASFPFWQFDQAGELEWKLRAGLDLARLHRSLRRPDGIHLSDESATHERCNQVHQNRGRGFQPNQQLQLPGPRSRLHHHGVLVWDPVARTSHDLRRLRHSAVRGADRGVTRRADHRRPIAGQRAVGRYLLVKRRYHSRSPRNASPRWLYLDFSSALSSANVFLICGK